MAITSCPKCEANRFEMKETAVARCNYRIFFVQCAECGAAIGAMDFITTNEVYAEVKRLKQALQGAGPL